MRACQLVPGDSIAVPHLEAAEKRLESAIARLETVLARRAGNSGASLQIDTLKADNAKLRDTAATVTQRLDVAISRIDSLLES